MTNGDHPKTTKRSGDTKTSSHKSDGKKESNAKKKAPKK